MDDNIKILLNSERNVDSVNVDTFTKINLQNSVSKFNEYNVRNVLSVTELFDIEREENEIYRISGKLEYVSLLNHIKSDYTTISDFFRPQKTGDTRTIFNSFDFYLVKPSDEEYTNIEPVYTAQTTPILDENFDNWVGGVPFGWIYTPGAGGNIEQAPGNRLRVNLGDNPILNIVGLSINIPPTTGNITLKSNVDITPNLDINDLMTIWFQNTSIESSPIFTINLLGDGVGEKNINITIPANTPANRINLIFNSTEKSMFMDYLRIIDTDSGDVLFDINNPPLNFPTTVYKRTFEVLTKLDNIDIMNAGFSKNVFNEQVYSYIINKDIDVSEFVDGFGFPITELFVYAQYKPLDNEVLSFEQWLEDGTFIVTDFEPQVFNIGDIIETDAEISIVDLVEFSKANFFQRLDIPQTFRIKSKPINNDFRVVWRYNPFIPISLRFFDDYLNVVNENSNNYNDLNRIPEYAFELNNGDYVWKDIMPEGYINPLTGVGSINPFVNKRRYLFAPITLNVIPDLEDQITRTFFQNIWFENNLIPINTNPISDINKINRPCL